MVKRIVSEDTILADDRGGTAPVREAKIYLPNYREVNHLLMEAPGSAAISFYDVLSKASIRMLETQERVYQGIERDSLIADVNTKYQVKIEEFNNENPTGKGFAEYATKTYNQLIDEASSNAQSAEVGQQIRALGYANLKGIANSSVQQENQKFVSYSLQSAQSNLETKYNQIQMFPDRFEGLSAEATCVVNNLEGVIPASALASFREHTKQNLFMSYGMGLVRVNPKQAESFLKNDFFSSNLSHENFNKLINFAEQRKKDEELKAYRYQKLMDNQRNGASVLEDYNVEVGTDLGSITLSDIKANTILTPLGKQRAIARWHRVNKEKLIEQQNFEKAASIWGDGGDISEIEPKYQQKIYSTLIRQKEAELQGSSDVTGESNHVTLRDKAIISSRFSTHIPELQTDLQNAIQFGSTAEKAEAAASLVFLMENNSKILKNVPQSYINFSTEVASRISAGVDIEGVVKFASERYLDEKRIAETGDFRKKANEAAAKLNIKEFYNSNFDYGFWDNVFELRRPGAKVVLSDRAQFETDARYEVRKATYGGAETPGDARAIAAANLKNYWKEVDGRLVRKPPSVVNPTLGEMGTRNKFAQEVRKLISAEDGFHLTNPIIKDPTKESDLYIKDLTVHKKPIVGIEMDGKIVEREVLYDSVNQVDGLYVPFVYVDDGKMFKKYFSNPDNPFLNAVIDMRPNGGE